MRYYGMNNSSAAEPVSNTQMRRESTMQSADMMRNNIMQNTDMTRENTMQQAQNMENAATESRTFNRPDGDGGIYNGLRAQNVRETEDFLEKAPQVVMPPGSNPAEMGMMNATVYEYPGQQMVHQQTNLQNGQMINQQTRPQNGMTCPIDMNFVNHLCGHRGDYLYVDMGGVKERQGVLTDVGRNYITLTDSGNHIMCPISAIKSITVYNYKK